MATHSSMMYYLFVPLKRIPSLTQFVLLITTIPAYCETECSRRTPPLPYSETYAMLYFDYLPD